MKKLLASLLGAFLLANSAFGETIPIKTLLKSAEHGDITAQRQLGIAYIQKEGVTVNPEEAQKWLLKAAEQGDILAQCKLGTLYTGQFGIRKDIGESIKWYRKAAENGDMGARYHLGMYYESGNADAETLEKKSFTPNYQESRKWLSLAAEQGEPAAACAVGMNYFHGMNGFPQDPVMAYMWMGIAAERSRTLNPAEHSCMLKHPDNCQTHEEMMESNAQIVKNNLELRDLFAKAMTPQQIEKAENKIAERLKAFSQKHPE